MTRLFIATMSLFTLASPIMAVESPSSSNVTFDNNSKCVAKALYWLDKATELAKSIKEENERNCILQHISELQRELSNAYLSKDLRNVGNICTHFSENAYEILAECSDFELREQILSCFCAMTKEVEKL